MATTDRFAIPYPDENQDPWYNAFKSMMTELDAAIFGNFESRNVVFYGGGSVAWDGSNLSWSASIVAICPSFGTLQTLSTAVSPLAVADERFVVFSLARGVASSVSLDTRVSVVSQVPIDEEKHVLCYRSGSSLYFATGIAMNAGDSIGGINVRPSTAMVVRESPTGNINGSNTSFSLAQAPNSGSEQVFLNGLLQQLTADYSITTTTINFTAAPVSGDVIRVTYLIPG
tara:strand:- start:405 stop:1091 length:687 start_codon:yes stop_codon:yes gene_type:complete